MQGHKFLVASDYLVKDGSVKKMYASYPSSGDFIRETLSKTENKVFYELMREGKPCKLFLDIEWIGQDDPEGRVIHHVVDKLKAYTKVRGPSLHSSAIKRNQDVVSSRIHVHCTCFLEVYCSQKHTICVFFSQRMNILYASKRAIRELRILEFSYEQPACIQYLCDERVS